MELDEAKYQMKRFVNEYRDSLLQNGCMYDGILWDCNERAKNNITGASVLGMLAGSLPEGFEWRDFNNNNHVVTLAYMSGLAAAIGTFYAKAYTASWEHKAAIDELTDVEEVLAYEYHHTLWPT